MSYRPPLPLPVLSLLLLLLPVLLLPVLSLLPLVLLLLLLLLLLFLVVFLGSLVDQPVASKTVHNLLYRENCSCHLRVHRIAPNWVFLPREGNTIGGPSSYNRKPHCPTRECHAISAIFHHTAQ